MGIGWSGGQTASFPEEVPGLHDQSKEIKGAPPATRGSYLNKDGDELFLTCDPKITTLYENFMHGKEVSMNGQCLGHRPTEDSEYVWIRYDEVLDQAKRFGAALLKLGFEHGTDTKIGLYAVNCPEWTIASLAASTQNIVIVPLYDTLGSEAVTHIINQAQIGLVLCDNYKKAIGLLENSGQMGTIQHIVVIKTDSEGKEKAESLAKSNDVGLISYKDFIANAEPTELHLPKADDLFVLCYTSGTTGTPKGVMLTHKNLLSMASCITFICDKFGVQPGAPGKSSISYLPLAHIFEQAVQTYMLYNGGMIGFFRGNTLKLLDDIKVLKPALFPVVPRLLNKLYDKIQLNVSKAGMVGQFLFKQGYNAKLAKLKQGIATKDTLWDKIIFKKIQQEVGGNVEFMVVGAAPTSAEVLELCRVALGCVLLEGYGQTECSAACSITMIGDAQGGHVGSPLPCNNIRLMDVPEMEYYAKDNKGEICIQGNNVMQGYYKDPEKTAEALDDDGWLHTGDVGQWLPNGTLKVIDRKKHIFKLAQGEYVAPEKIEQVYQRMPLVSQIFIDGNSHERYLIAVIIPDKDAVKHWVKGTSLEHKTYEELCVDPSLTQHIQKEMNKFGKSNGLNSIEQAKAIHVDYDEFTVENDLLTPTMKSKRPQLRAKYKEIIDNLYEDNNQNTGKP